MLFITYLQTSGGRSGHKLGEIFTTFIFSKLLDINVLYNTDWNKQLILSEKSLKKYSYNFKGKFDGIVKIDYIKKWDCLTWEDFNTIKQKISNLDRTKNILVELSNVCKIYPHIVYDWRLKKYIQEDLYNLKILPTLRNIYFDDHKDDIKDCISIHIRCGDMYQRLLKAGFTFEYYKNLIDTLNSHCQTKINVYCENKNYQDVYKLKDCKNTEVYIGGPNKFTDHFNCMVNSKVLILSPSSMAAFAGYLCKGLVLIDNKSAKFRNNVFHSSENIFLRFDSIIEKLDLIK